MLSLEFGLLIHYWHAPVIIWVFAAVSLISPEQGTLSLVAGGFVCGALPIELALDYERARQRG